MKTLFKAVSVAAGISVAALVGVASAAQAEEIHIQTADLNLNSSADAARFDDRVNTAARQMCAAYTNQFAQHEACVSAVRDEANARLSEQVAQLQTQSGTAVASAR